MSYMVYAIVVFFVRQGLWKGYEESIIIISNNRTRGLSVPPFIFSAR